MMKEASLLLVALFVCGFLIPQSDAVPLNVHVVAHTHDDVGWLKTPDEYYYGANESIQDAGVQYILDTVIVALQQNPSRKFIYVEIAFFFRWWREQDEATRQIVKKLVASGQLEFINGGWTMHDEACVHFEDMVDQMTLGHQFLFQTFGVVPKVGWQIDPFGHSATNAIVDNLAGFEALFFARMDYQDLQIREQQKAVEMMWQPSESLPDIHLLTGMLTNGYCDPGGFMFEYGDDPIMDDPLLENFNLYQKAEDLVKIVKAQASFLRHNDVLVSWGCDFMYQNAHLMFKNIEKLMTYINSNSTYNVTLFYSTPSIYAEAIFAEHTVLPMKYGDFMPYADGPHSYWSGYFTSRATLKGFVRFSSALLHATTSLLSSSQISSPAIDATLVLVQQPNGVTTHHDAVTGTEQFHVADDYAKNLNIANTNAYTLLSEVYGTILNGKTAPIFYFCPLLNETLCPATTILPSSVVPIVVYNPLAWDRTETIRLPIPVATVSVTNSAGKQVPAQVNQGNGRIELIFTATVPPLGFTTYFLESSATTPTSTEVAPSWEPLAPFVLGNEHISVQFDAHGNIQSVADKVSGASLPLQQQYYYYISSIGPNNTQSSGAYIFRPDPETPVNYELNVPNVTVVNGSLVSEVIRYFQNDLTQVIRIYNNQWHIEIEDVIGPINISDGNGKEVITRYTTNLNTAGLWYSDSNGIELIQRTRNARADWNYTVTEPVAGNYVPVDTFTYIKDVNEDWQVTVLVDRSRSSASLADGQIETMLHRRCLKDDGRGVGEPLNDSKVLATTEWLVVSNSSSSASLFRPLAKRLYHPLQLAFSQTSSVSNWRAQYKTDYSPLSAALPPNVQLLDFVPLPSGNYILRLHHIYQVGEDSVLSQPVTVDISTILAGYKIVSVQETQLTAVAPVKRKDAINWSGPSAAQAIPVLLAPTEIRTFVVVFAANVAPKLSPISII